MPRRVPLDPASHPESLRTRDHEEWGVTVARLRSADVAHPFHGINRLGPAPGSVAERVASYRPLLRGGDAFSHTTAALLWGAPLPVRLEVDPTLHITSTGGLDRPVRVGVRGYRSSEVELSRLGSLPVVSPREMWFQMASLAAFDDLVAIGDYLVSGSPWARPRRALATPGELQAHLSDRAGRRGAARARRAAGFVRTGVDSRSETLLRLLLVRSGLPEPAIAHPIAVSGGVLHVDLAYPEAGLAIEYEGDGHRTDRASWRGDIHRRELIEDRGWRVLRVTGDDLRPSRHAELVRRVRSRRA